MAIAWIQPPRDWHMGVDLARPGEKDKPVAVAVTRAKANPRNAPEGPSKPF